SAIYWGRGKNSKDNLFLERTHLPSQNCQKAEIGDLNGDGLVDVVFAFAGGFWEYRNSNAKGAPSRIYWNSTEGFTEENFTDLTTLGATDVAVGDLNLDGRADLVFANGDKGTPSYVYFGGTDGVNEENRLELPTTTPHAVEIADVNGDQRPDIVFANSS